jgi:CheY-like chemotaxis protein
MNSNLSIHNKLLLVEDNPMDVDLTKRAFAMNKLPVIIEVAGDGEEAIGFIKKWEDGLPVPKVILLDLKLPKSEDCRC